MVLQRIAKATKMDSVRRLRNRSKKNLLSKDEIIAGFRLMLLSRKLDEKMQILIKQGKSFFHIGCMGHEAIQVAAAICLKKRSDWLFPYYRDQAICLGFGETALGCMLAFLGKADDKSSGARQLPQHYGNKDLNIPSSSSSTGTQYLQALGCALASMRIAKTDGGPLEVTIVCSGDGTTSQGDFHEALNWASREAVPIIFLVQNNGYAISVPTRNQCPDGDVYALGKGYGGLRVEQVDGCDFVESHRLMRDCVEHARSKKGPVLIDASVVRLLPHSSSDDQKKYRTKDELAADKLRDPVLNLSKWMIDTGIIEEKAVLAIDFDVKNEVENAVSKALKAPFPDGKTATDFVFAIRKDGDSKSVAPEIDPLSKDYVMVDAINRALSEEIVRNDRVLVFGQDVAGGKGGVFTATRGLTKQFGDSRCFNAPLAESSIIGVSIGLSLRGFMPVPEIQFSDYVWTAMMQIRNELSTLRYRSNNTFFAPVVIRLPIGGYIHGGLCHSQNIEATFSHFPGLKIALPSTAIDAYGLLKEAIRGDDPVLFLEHKSLYRQGFAKSKLPGPDFCQPFGVGAIRRHGSDATVVTYGAMVQRTLEAARDLEKDGIDIEVIDLRTIVPYDRAMVIESVRKTSRALVLHEDTRLMGFGAEIASEIGDTCFKFLDAPVKRLAAKDTPIPYAPALEEAILPQTAGIVSALRELCAY